MHIIDKIMSSTHNNPSLSATYIQIFAPETLKYLAVQLVAG